MIFTESQLECHGQKYKIPMKLPSLANRAGRWKGNYFMNKVKCATIRRCLANLKITPPCKVIITRIAPRMLDTIDNLPMSVKFVIDTVADMLIPGLKPGRADGDSRVKFEIQQRKGDVRENALEIFFQRILHED